MATDAQIIEYLKANHLLDPMSAAADRVIKDATAGDVHVPSALPDESTVDDDKAAQAEVAKRLTILKSIDSVDVVFSKGEANLYVSRPLQEASALRLHAWATEQGIKNIVPPELMHVTQVHSKDEVELEPLLTTLEIDCESRWLGQLGKGNVLVMYFRSPEMQARFKEAQAAGASWDFKSFIPHITISYDTDDVQANEYGFDPAPDFPLQLGPEVFQDNNDNWINDNKLAKADGDGFAMPITVTKADAERRMIWGWASISSVNGIEVIDKQEDIIPTAELEKAVYDFVLYSRDHGEMHAKVGTGKMIESMVFTQEKAAQGIVAKNEKGEQIEGWWVGFRVDDPATWALAKAGKLPEFSIGGKATPHTV